MLQLFAKYHKILRTENFEAAPGKSFSFLESVKLLGHQLQKNHIHPLKWKIDVFLRLQPSKNRKEIQNHVRFLKFTSKHFYNLQVFSGPIYLQIRDAIDFKLTPELQQTFDKFKKFKKAIANSENLFSALPQTKESELHSSKKNLFGKMEFVCANSRFFYTTEFRLSILFCECSAHTIYAYNSCTIRLRISYSRVATPPPPSFSTQIVKLSSFSSHKRTNQITRSTSFN